MIFTLAVCPGCGPGGAGGGLAFPGSGVVLDLILPIQKLLSLPEPGKGHLPIAQIPDQHGFEPILVLLVATVPRPT